MHQNGPHIKLSSNSPRLAARDDFEFSGIQRDRGGSRADLIPWSLLQGEFILCKTRPNMEERKHESI